MAAAPQGGGGQGDNSGALLWIIAALFAALGAIWYVFNVQLVTSYLTFKTWELSLLNFFAGLVGQGHYFDSLQLSYQQARDHAAQISFQQLMAMGAEVGRWLRIPLAAVLVVLGVIVFFSNSTRVYRRTYNMMDFAKLESKNWPQITPVVNLDLIKVDIDTGPWAMAQTPMQFCKRNNLLIEMRPVRREGMSRKDWDRIEVALKRGKANQLFAMQLGALWTGPDKLPMHVKALFAVFAARINADSAPAAKILTQLSASSLDKNLNYAGVEELLKKHKDSKLVRKVTDNHAYVYTVMASMLLAAREDGVQASADFLWLKPKDRRLWYVLNTVGRQTPFIEVAGIFAHWVAEREAARKLIVPMIETATNAVELALKDIVYRPDEETEK